MNRFTVAILVNNQLGVVNRVTSMFRRRQFNIHSLTVSETHTTEYSRITIQSEGDEVVKQQLINQLYKLPDVSSVSRCAGARICSVSTVPERRSTSSRNLKNCFP